MLFYILLFLWVLPTISLIITLFDEHRGYDAVDNRVFLIALTSIFTFPFSLWEWSYHAKNLSTIAYQDVVIKDYEERIASLDSRLQAFDYPKSALLNADTPVASIVKSISDAESGLLDAKTARSQAILSVETTRNGPMSGVISFVGDYKAGGE